VAGELSATAPTCKWVCLGLGGWCPNTLRPPPTCHLTPLHTHSQDVQRRVNESPEARSEAGRRVLEAAVDLMNALEGKE